MPALACGWTWCADLMSVSCSTLPALLPSHSPYFGPTRRSYFWSLYDTRMKLSKHEGAGFNQLRLKEARHIAARVEAVGKFEKR